MCDARKEYGDIIDMPHHQSKRHKQMSMGDRAAQFAPFAALRGYDEEVEETARVTDSKVDLSAEEINALNETLHLIIDEIKSRPSVMITYFVPDEKKTGGAYVSVTGNVRRVDEIEKIIILADDRRIPIEDIYDITIKEQVI